MLYALSTNSLARFDHKSGQRIQKSRKQLVKGSNTHFGFVAKNLPSYTELVYRKAL